MAAEPRWLDDTEMRAWTGFLETANLLQREIDRQLRQDGALTQSQYEILSRLAEASGHRRRMTELADRLVASRSGLTYQVTKLEKAGLVRREGFPSDERGVVAVVTDAGLQILNRAAPGHVRVVREGLIDLLDGQQLTQLAEIMDLARARLRARQAGIGGEHRSTS